MRRSYLTLVAVVASVACKDKPAPPPPPAPPHDGVIVIQPGIAPLQVLRYTLIKGAVTASRLVCDVDLQNGDARDALPTQILDLETMVEDVLADGTAKLRIKVIDAAVRERPDAGGARPSAAGGGSGSAGSGPGSGAGSGSSAGSGSASSSGAMDVIRAQTAALRGVVITESLGPDGQVSNAHVEGDDKDKDKLHRDLDTLLRSLERVTTRLPAEPVGVGASWRERRTLPEGGIRATSEITYTLASLTGTTMAFTSVGRSAGDPQTIEQDGSKVEVTDTHGRTEAIGSVDLSRYAIDVSARSTFSTTMAVIAPDAGASAGPGAERSTIEIAMMIRMSSGEAPATAAASAGAGSGAGTGSGSGLGAGSGAGTGSGSGAGSGDATRSAQPGNAGAQGSPDQGAHNAP